MRGRCQCTQPGGGRWLSGQVRRLELLLQPCAARGPSDQHLTAHPLLPAPCGCGVPAERKRNGPPRFPSPLPPAGSGSSCGCWWRAGKIAIRCGERGEEVGSERRGEAVVPQHQPLPRTCRPVPLFLISHFAFANYFLGLLPSSLTKVNVLLKKIFAPIHYFPQRCPNTGL